MMKFNVEIELNGRVFSSGFHAESLQDLNDQIKRIFPLGKVVTIIGG